MEKCGAHAPSEPYSEAGTSPKVHRQDKPEARYELHKGLTHMHTETTQVVHQMRHQWKEPVLWDPVLDLADRLRGAHRKGHPHDDHKAEATPHWEPGRPRFIDAEAAIEGLCHDIAALQDRQGKLEAGMPRTDLDALRRDVATLRERQGELQARLPEAAIEGLRRDIAALRARQGELEAGMPKADLDALRRDIVALRERKEQPFKAVIDLRGDISAMRRQHEQQAAEAANAHGAALDGLRKDLEVLRERTEQQEPGAPTEIPSARFGGELDADLRVEINRKFQRLAATLQKEMLSHLSLQAVKLEAKLQSMEADIKEHRRCLEAARRSSSWDPPRVAHAEAPKPQRRRSYGGSLSAPRAEVPHTMPTRPVSLREGPPPQQQRARSMDPVRPRERPKQSSHSPVRRASRQSQMPSPMPHDTRSSTPGQDLSVLTSKSVTQSYIGSPLGPASRVLPPASFHALSMGPPVQHSPGPTSRHIPSPAQHSPGPTSRHVSLPAQYSPGLTSRHVSLPIGRVSHPPGWHGAKSVPVPPLMMWHSRSVAPKTGQTGTG